MYDATRVKTCEVQAMRTLHKGLIADHSPIMLKIHPNLPITIDYVSRDIGIHPECSIRQRGGTYYQIMKKNEKMQSYLVKR